MSWYCKKCETNNEDTDDICLVCNSIPPVWDSVNCKIDSTGTTFRLSWRVNNANKVTILYGGAYFDVSRVYSYDLKISEERQVVFEAENDVATRVFTYTLTESQSLELEKRREQERIAKQKRQDDLAWAATCRWDAEDSYTTYLRNYPSGIHCIEAKKRIEKLKEERKEADEQLWKRSCFVNMSSAYSKYIKEYPAGTYISEAKKKYEECKDNEDWSRASSTNTLESYQKYLKNHPNGNFSGNAKVIILRLEAEEKEREEQRKKVAEQARIKAKKKAILKNIKTIFLCQIIPVCIIYGIYMVYSGKPSNNRANTYIQQPQKLEMNDYARSLESDIDKQLKSLEIAKQYNIGLDYNMKQKVGDKLEELSKYNSNRYKGYKERYDKL